MRRDLQERLRKGKAVKVLGYVIQLRLQSYRDTEHFTVAVDKVPEIGGVFAFKDAGLATDWEVDDVDFDLTPPRVTATPHYDGRF